MSEIKPFHPSEIHSFVVLKAWKVSRDVGGRHLDYGCGAGEIVSLALDSGLDSVGCDVFYDGGSYRDAAMKSGLLGSRIHEMTDSRAPFGDGEFDVVTSNQVLEHVPDLEQTMADMVRITRPGGAILLLFPTRDVWREGHVGVPFIHWFSPSSRARQLYAIALRSMGFGYFKGEKSVSEWASYAGAWLDKYTFYRPSAEVASCLERHSLSVERCETEYLRFRASRMAGAKGSIVRFAVSICPQFVANWLVRKLSGWVVVCRRSVV